MKVRVNIRGAGMDWERVTEIVRSWNFPVGWDEIRDIVRIFDLEDAKPFEFLLKEMLNMRLKIRDLSDNDEVILELSTIWELESDDGMDSSYSENSFRVKLSSHSGKIVSVKAYSMGTNLEAGYIYSLLGGIHFDVDKKTVEDMLKAFYRTVNGLVKKGYRSLEIGVEFTGEEERWVPRRNRRRWR